MAKLALLQAWVCGSACAACKCANVRLAKIELKKMCGGENKKYRSVGNECRLTRCPFIISFLCRWSPVKMVYFFLVYVRLCLLCRVFLRLLVTFGSYKKLAIPEHKTVNLHESLIEKLNYI